MTQTTQTTRADYERLLLDAYRGEVFGARFFRAMADGPHGAEHAGALDALARIEARTASGLRPLVIEARLDEGASDADEQGVDLAAGVADQAWPAFLEGLRGALPAFLANFLDLQRVDAGAHAAVMADLVAHEQAIDRFAELALAGDESAGLAVLGAHLATPAPA